MNSFNQEKHIATKPGKSEIEKPVVRIVIISKKIKIMWDGSVVKIG